MSESSSPPKKLRKTDNNSTNRLVWRTGKKSDECERVQGDKLCLVSQKYFLDLEKHPSPKK